MPDVNKLPMRLCGSWGRAVLIDSRIPDPKPFTLIPDFRLAKRPKTWQGCLLSQWEVISGSCLHVEETLEGNVIHEVSSPITGGSWYVTR